MPVTCQDRAALLPTSPNVTWSLPGELNLILAWYRKRNFSHQTLGLQCPLLGFPNERCGHGSQGRYL